MNQVENKEKDVSRFFIFSLFFTAILLHQSNVVFGVNISFADFFCGLLLIFLVTNRRFLIPIGPLVFFFMISILALVSANLYIPIKFAIASEPIRIISDFTKLMAIFIYFLIGYNLAKLHLVTLTIRWYSMFGYLVGMIGILFTLLNIRILSDLLFFADTRFKGLMIDPNYFSVLQITALVYMTRSETIKLPYKFIAVIITLFSVLSTGSKTGMITLFGYFVFRILEYLFLKKKNLPAVVAQFVLGGLLVLGLALFYDFVQQVLTNLAGRIPSFSRVYLLFSDFGAAISEGGSGREDTWKAAFQVIQVSPVFGIGVGTYTTISWKMFAYDNVAHNTFLQITAEWGIPMAFFFIIYVIYLLATATNSRHVPSTVNIIIRDMVIILLMGSMAISLNNARILWLLLGALFFLHENKCVTLNEFQLLEFGGNDDKRNSRFYP